MEIQDFFTPQVIWFLIGVVFLLLELAIPGLILVFFGFGAWITSLSIVLFDIELNTQLVIFTVASALSLVLLRKFLSHKFFGESDKKNDVLEDEFIGKRAIAESEFKKDIPGKLNFRGTTWSAVSDCDIGKGDNVKVVGKESITLNITKIN
jgi:membrane protein implicated in regulation of membrane protease activity